MAISTSPTPTTIAFWNTPFPESAIAAQPERGWLGGEGDKFRSCSSGNADQEANGEYRKGDGEQPLNDVALDAC